MSEFLLMFLIYFFFRLIIDFRFPQKLKKMSSKPQTIEELRKIIKLEEMEVSNVK